MQINLNDDAVDDIVTAVMLQGIECAYETATELLAKDELQHHQRDDLAMALEDLAAMKIVYKRFTLQPEHDKLNEYRVTI